MMVIDEADLTLSYGYQGDIEQIKNYLPRIYQGFLMSATLSEESFSIYFLTYSCFIEKISSPYPNDS